MIQTVLGPIEKSQMGKTLSHEHFDWEYDEAVALKMYFHRQYDDKQCDKKFVQLFPLLDQLKTSGCQTVVEASPPLGGQNLLLLHALSRKSNVNIIPCTGMNITKHAHRIFPDFFEQQLAHRWIQDYTNGLDTIDGVCIRPGFIKLLLDRDGISPVDEAMLKAAAIACNKTGLPIHCHVMESAYLPNVMSLLDSMHVNPCKFVWAHADVESHLDMILSVVREGYWVGFDTIREGVYDKRKNLLEHAIEHGYHQQILLSQDLDFCEESLKKDGIDRCASLFKKFIPYCVQEGLCPKTLDRILSQNPARFYHF